MITSTPVRFRKQGGNTITGLAIGRMGSQILIQYRVTSGEERERWLPKGRYDETPELQELPRYKRAKCDGKRDETGRCSCGVPRWNTAPTHAVIVPVDPFFARPGESVVLECEGHEPQPGSSDPQGVTVYCDGSCRAVAR